MFIYDSVTQPRKYEDDEEFIDGIGSAEMQSVTDHGVRERNALHGMRAAAWERV